MSLIEECELLITCNFFISEVKVESIANRFKQRYCYSCKEACAIYMVYTSTGPESVPMDLFPNEYDKALEIIAKNR